MSIPRTIKIKKNKTIKKTRTRTIKKDKKDKKDKEDKKTKTYYYLVRSEFMNDIDPVKKIKKLDYFINLFKKRGNWKEFNPSLNRGKNIKNGLKVKNPDLLYLDGEYLYDKKYSNLRNYKIKLANISDMKSDNDSISSKYNLIENLKKTNIPRKHLQEQIYINLYDIYKIKEKADSRKENELIEYYKKLFDKYKVMIFKPIFGIQGRDIIVFDNFNDFYNTINNMIEEKKNKLKNMNETEYYKKGVEARYFGFNIEWILQEYITNPLLFKDRKFHIRGYFIYHCINSKEKKFYLSKNMTIFTAKLPYKNSNYQNKDIHDTHAEDTIKGLSFYNDISNMLGKEKTKEIEEQIKTIFKYISSIINSKCYPEAENCFHIFGYDVMITDDLKVKIIETNYRPGSPRIDILSGLFDKIIDYHFPPYYNSNSYKKIEDLDNYETSTVKCLS